MEMIIDSILQIEQDGKERILQAIADKNRIIADAKSEEERLINEGIAAADNQLKQLEDEGCKNSEKLINEIEKAKKEQIDKLNQVFNLNKEKWSDEIFKSIVNI